MDNEKLVSDFIKSIIPKLKNEPTGLFKYPYLSVTYGDFYSDCIFSWDNHHMSLALASLGEVEQLKYFLGNMFTIQDEDGFTPCVPNSIDGGINTSKFFHAQPFLAQNAAKYLKKSNDIDFIKEIYPKLEKYFEHWIGEKFQTSTGLFHWGETYMSGIDNEIVGTLFQVNDVVSPDLNSLLYLEAQSLEFIAKKLNLDSEFYTQFCEKQYRLINQYLWCDKYKCYGSYLISEKQVKIGMAGPDAPKETGKYAYLSCPCIYTIFANVAPKERAIDMITKYILAPEHFRSKFGIRSLSKSSEYCNNARWGNPPRFGCPERLTNSNWQGPVWILINYLTFQGLLNYGFINEAQELCKDTTNLLANCIKDLGFMRENFDETTGEGLYADYFGSWNLLAIYMINKTRKIY